MRDGAADPGQAHLVTEPIVIPGRRLQVRHEGVVGVARVYPASGGCGSIAQVIAGVGDCLATAGSSVVTGLMAPVHVWLALVPCRPLYRHFTAGAHLQDHLPCCDLCVEIAIQDRPTAVVWLAGPQSVHLLKLKAHGH